MTKEEARIRLTDYLNSTTTIWSESIQLPITDVNINTISSEVDTALELSTHIETYTFKGLLKIAYDLHD